MGRVIVGGKVVIVVVVGWFCVVKTVR